MTEQGWIRIIYCNYENQKINDNYKNKDQKDLPKYIKFNVPKINNLQSELADLMGL
jgi:hypothetical protein